MANKTKEECDKIIESGVVHFTVGEDLGLRLMEIAQEHLLYNLDPSKAVLAITDSLMGIESRMDLVYGILRGDYVLPVDVDTQEVMLSEREEGQDDRFPKLNIQDWYKRQANEMLESGVALNKAIERLVFDLQHHKFKASYDLGQVLKYVAGGNKDILEDLLEDNEDFGRVANVVNVVKKYIERSLKVKSVIDWSRKTYPEDFKEEKRYIKDFTRYQKILADVMISFKELYETDFSRVERLTPELDSYLESAIENDKIISKGIEPVDIMDKYDAGWLSPEGVYYALNGEIANMLHIQIADALQEKGIVPSKPEGEVGVELNAFEWLETHGWIKIHGNNVHFDGCNNFQKGKKNVDMTDKQIVVIRDYITNCYACEIKAGWRMEKQSIGMFTALAMGSLEALYKKYFEY